MERSGVVLQAHPWLPDAVTGPAEVLVAEVSAGRAYIQDPASQVVADLVASLPGETVADLCAAPGGKAARWALRRGTPPVIADRALGRVGH